MYLVDCIFLTETHCHEVPIGHVYIESICSLSTYLQLAMYGNSEHVLIMCIENIIQFLLHCVANNASPSFIHHGESAPPAPIANCPWARH